jgi:hypothetical protein
MTGTANGRRIHLRTCPRCEAMCGLEVHVRDKPGTRLSVGSEHAGVNTNVLSPGEFVDVLSGNAAVNGLPVTVTPG